MPPDNIKKEELETLSEQIHHLYCAQYLKDHGAPYWTEGDYSKLEERVKEYDRNIARFILEREASLLSEIREKVAGMRKPNNCTCAPYDSCGCRIVNFNEAIDTVLASLMKQYDLP